MIYLLVLYTIYDTYIHTYLHTYMYVNLVTICILNTLLTCDDIYIFLLETQYFLTQTNQRLESKNKKKLKMYIKSLIPRVWST